MWKKAKKIAGKRNIECYWQVKKINCGFKTHFTESCFPPCLIWINIKSDSPNAGSKTQLQIISLKERISAWMSRGSVANWTWSELDKVQWRKRRQCSQPNRIAPHLLLREESKISLQAGPIFHSTRFGAQRCRFFHCQRLMSQLRHCLDFVMTARAPDFFKPSFVAKAALSSHALSNRAHIAARKMRVHKNQDILSANAVRDEQKLQQNLFQKLEFKFELLISRI